MTRGTCPAFEVTTISLCCSVETCPLWCEGPFYASYNTSCTRHNHDTPHEASRHMTRLTRHVTCITRHVTRITRHVTHDTRHGTRITSHVTRITRHVTRDTRHVTRDAWCVFGLLHGRDFALASLVVQGHALHHVTRRVRGIMRYETGITRHVLRITRYVARITRHVTRITRHVT